MHLLAHNPRAWVKKQTNRPLEELRVRSVSLVRGSNHSDLSTLYKLTTERALKGVVHILADYFYFFINKHIHKLQWDIQLVAWLTQQLAV